MVKPKFVKKAGAFLAAAALSAMLAPGLAMADEPVNSTTGPDNVVVVNWTEGGVGYSCNVDLDQIAQHTNKMGSLFFKNGVYNVLGTSQYVTLSDVIDEAVSGSHAASDVWDDDSDYVTFDVWNYNNDVYTVEEYVKYTLGFTKAKLDGCNNFYGGTKANTLVTDTVEEYADGAILALNGQSVAMTNGDLVTTAQNTLDAMSSLTGATAPRLMWGYESTSEAGNRFPSNIDSITITDVA